MSTTKAMQPRTPMVSGSMRREATLIAGGNEEACDDRRITEIRSPRRHEDRLGRADRDGRRRGPALRRLPADRRGEVPGDPHLRSVREVAALRADLQDLLGQDGGGASGRARRL